MVLGISDDSPSESPHHGISNYSTTLSVAVDAGFTVRTQSHLSYYCLNFTQPFVLDLTQPCTHSLLLEMNNPVASSVRV